MANNIETTLTIRAGPAPGLDKLKEANAEAAKLNAGLLESGQAAEFARKRLNEIAVQEMAGNKAIEAQAQQRLKLIDAITVRQGAQQASAVKAINEQVEFERLRTVAIQKSDAAVEEFNKDLGPIPEHIETARKNAESFRQELEKAAAAATSINQFGGVGSVPFGPFPEAPAATRGKVTGALAAQHVSALFGGTEFGRLANTTGDIAKLIQDIPKLEGGFTGLLTSVGPLAIGTGIVALGFRALTDQLAEGAREVEASLAGFERRRAVEREIRDNDLETIDIKERLAAAQLAQLDAERDRADLEGVDDAAFSDAIKGKDFIGVIGVRVGTALVSLGGGFNSIEEAIDAADEAVATSKADIAEYTEALKDGRTASNDAAAAARDYADAVKAASDAQNEAIQNAVGALGDLRSSFIGQRDDRREERGIRLQDQGQDAFIDNVDDFVDGLLDASDRVADINRGLEQQELQHKAKIEQIENTGNDRVEKLRADSVQKVIDATEQTADIESKARLTERRARAEFRRDEERAERRATLSKLEALNEGSFGDIARIDRERSEARNNAREDFRAEREARKENVAARVAEIQRELGEFVQLTDSRIRLEQEATQQAIESAEAEYIARLQFDQQTRDIQAQRAERDSQIADSRAERDSKRAAEREDRDFARTEAKAEDAYNAGIKRIQDTLTAEHNRYLDVLGDIDEVRTKEDESHTLQMANETALQQAFRGSAELIARINTQLGNNGTGSNTSGGIGGGTGVLPFPAFASGAYVARPTFALIAERGPEWVLNQGQMAGLMNRRSGPQISMAGMFDGATFGSVTQRDISTLKDEFTEAMSIVVERLIDAGFAG